jgi:outer membrane protein OmpA-like peptidoglycan-associated protein
LGVKSSATKFRSVPASQLAPSAHARPFTRTPDVRRILRAPQVQPKLKIGAVDDPAEREADRVADQVMRMPARDFGLVDEAPPPRARTANVLQRQCACGGSATTPGECPACASEREGTLRRKATTHAEPSHAPPQVPAVLYSPGRPLDAVTRAFMEPRFGHDFTSVRIHADSAAAGGPRAVQARAYTLGRDIVFGADQYSTQTREGKRLLAHELTHVVQQGRAEPRPTQNQASEPSPTRRKNSEQASNVIRRAGDPAAIPVGFACPTDLTPGAPAGADVLFAVGQSSVTPAHTTLLTTFVATWLAAGGTDDILVHGYSSTDGDQGPNWTLSCTRAQAVQAELLRLGVPAVRISIVAHGESTDFGAGEAANRHAVVSSSPASPISLPIVTGTLTPVDNFAGHSPTNFGVGEVINLDFVSVPPRPAADFGGLQWVLAAGAGTLTGATNVGTATYTAPATAGAVQLELRVASGATAGRVISTRAITIAIPSAVRMVAVPGTAPTFAGTIVAGDWGAGFQANVFVDPKNVSFQGVVFGEGTVTAVVTGRAFSAFVGDVHQVNTFGPAHGGNATTGTPVSPPVDNIMNSGGVAPHSLLGVNICGSADFLWAIPWEFSVAGGPRTAFAGGFTANHHVTCTTFCNATIEKGGAGPFCRRLDGTTC